MYAHPDAVADRVGMAIYFFVNFDIFNTLASKYICTPSVGAMYVSVTNRV